MLYFAVFCGALLVFIGEIFAGEHMGFKIVITRMLIMPVPNRGRGNPSKLGEKGVEFRFFHESEILQPSL